MLSTQSAVIITISIAAIIITLHDSLSSRQVIDKCIKHRYTQFVRFAALYFLLLTLPSKRKKALL
jgi:ABC-type bacteriocin/lantibiotic exporter with double-glycine peptidase domain